MNITFIGMPGVGKSYLGKIVAEKQHLLFVDLDLLLERRLGCSVQQILKIHGVKRFLRFEEDIVLSLPLLEQTLISTSGSIVYCPRAMERLKNCSIVIFLHASLPFIASRLSSRQEKNIVGLSEKGLPWLFKERDLLYRSYADFIVNIEHLSETKIVKKIVSSLLKSAPAGKVELRS